MFWDIFEERDGERGGLCSIKMSTLGIPTKGDTARFCYNVISLYWFNDVLFCKIVKKHYNGLN